MGFSTSSSQSCNFRGGPSPAWRGERDLRSGGGRPGLGCCRAEALSGSGPAARCHPSAGPARLGLLPPGAGSLPPAPRLLPRLAERLRRVATCRSRGWRESPAGRGRGPAGIPGRARRSKAPAARGTGHATRSRLCFFLTGGRRCGEEGPPPASLAAAPGTTRLGHPLFSARGRSAGTSENGAIAQSSASAGCFQLTRVTLSGEGLSTVQMCPASWFEYQRAGADGPECLYKCQRPAFSA